MKVSYFTCCVFLLAAGSFGVKTASAVAQIRITGTESPLIYGISRDITCSATGMEVATMQWLLVVIGFEVPFLSGTDVNELVLNLSPSQDGTDLNGAVFKCVAVDTGGRRYQDIITISVEELEHSMSITASSDDAVVAGSSLILNCTATSNHVPLLTWVGPNAPVIAENGITLLEQVDGDLKSAILTFDPLRTSHAGNYTCISIIENNLSKLVSQHLVIVEIPPPNLTPLRDLSTLIQPFNNEFTVTYLIALNPAVDTPVEVTAQWHGHSSISNSSHVTLSEPAARPPYYASLTFSPLQESDVGMYVVTVKVFSISDDVDTVRNSTEVHVSMHLSTSLAAQINTGDATVDAPVLDFNECEEGTHNCEQICSNTVGSYTCSCNSGYRLSSNGRNCDDVNECNVNNGGCQQVCVNTIASYNCQCSCGYRLSSNGRSCIDINECSEGTHGCDQTCTNTPGSFVCSCNNGYRLSSNGRSCEDMSWFESGTQLCYKWRPDGDGGQCGGGAGRELCANVGDFTDFYWDDTDNRGGGCRMQWGIMSPRSPAWFRNNVQVCYRWYPDGNGGQCGGGAPREMCRSVGAYTQEYRDDTDNRGGGCRMSWKISIPAAAPQWIRNIRLCFIWMGGSQCGGGVSHHLCARANQWTTYYRDDTDNRGGGCHMSWGLLL